jgi:hypothetical protein
VSRKRLDGVRDWCYFSSNMLEIQQETRPWSMQRG